MKIVLPKREEALSRVELIHPVMSGWPQIVLMLAGLYNLLFGLWAIFFPSHYLNFTGISTEAEPLWQCIGMIVGLYGLGYFIASTNIIRYWPLVLIGFLGKIFGPLGFLWHIFNGALATSGLILIVFNDLIWLIPFAMILIKAFHLSWQHENNIFYKDKREKINEVYDIIESNSNEKLILIYIRHMGCSFSKLLINGLNKDFKSTNLNDYKLCLVTMSTKEKVDIFFDDELRSKVNIISDPSQCLYQFFNIKRGNLLSVINLVVIKESFKIIGNPSCAPGYIDGDGFQLSGLILIENGEIRKRVIHKTVLNEGSIVEQLKLDKERKVPKLFFDGDCPLCKREIAFLKTLCPSDEFEFIDLANYKETAKKEFGKSYDQLMAEIHGMDADGNWLIGMDAFRLVYSFTPYGGLFSLTKLPLVKQILDLGYKLFAKNRLRLTGRHCKDNVCA